jgi:hypothetical protein
MRVSGYPGGDSTQQHLIYVNRFVAELGVCITANTLVIAVKVGLVGPYAKIGHV